MFGLIKNYGFVEKKRKEGVVEENEGLFKGKDKNRMRKDKEEVVATGDEGKMKG